MTRGPTARRRAWCRVPPVCTTKARNTKHQGFDDLLARAATSAAYARLGRRVHGLAMGQLGLLDREQLETLIEVLALSPGERLLEVGCGNGGLAEYLARRSGARIVGIDIAEEAIGRATLRNRHHPRLDFRVADMDHLELGAERFEAAVGVDSLYLASDLAVTLTTLASHLGQDGRMALLCSERLGRGEAPMVGALRRLRFGFHEHDLSHCEVALWQRQAEALDDLREAFEDEGNQVLWQTLARETERCLPWARRGEIRRVLYEISVRAPDH